VVARIEAIPVALPVRREWRWRGLGGELGRWVVVRVHTDDGLVGLGEATPLPDWGGDFNHRAGETPATVVHVVSDLLTPVVVGTDPFDVERTLVRMDAVVSGHAYAKAAVEMALHDLQGRVTGQPLYKLLGGRFRDGVEVAHMIGIMPPEEAVDEAQAAIADGCRAFQIKGTGQLARDVEVVSAVREAAGPDVLLRLDANQGYSGSGTKAAVRAVRRLVEAGVDMVEQPGEGLAELAAVRAAVDVEVIADESAWDMADVLDVVRTGAADAISIYIAKAGGLARARRVAVLAEAHGMPCDVNGSLESGIGTAANVHLATAMPAIDLPAVISVSAPRDTGAARAAGRYYADDLLTQPLRWEDGRLFAPEGPGLGVEIDEDKLAAYRVAVA
jgi:muconate cycloisomerase